MSKVDNEVAAGRLQEPGGKRVFDSWSKVELGALKRAVALHGRDWAAVASSVGSKTRQQCMDKVVTEVAAGRMQEPGGKQVQDEYNRSPRYSKDVINDFWLVHFDHGDRHKRCGYCPPRRLR
jgi:hypothetical protein